MKIGNKSSTVIPNAVIAGVITLQLIPFFSEDWTFPFISYPMYSHASQPGPYLVPHSKVILRTRSGKEIYFLPLVGQELSRSVSIYGLSQTTYQRHYLDPMISDPKTEKGNAIARELGKRINREAEDPVVKIEVTVEKFQLDDGQIEKTKSYSNIYDIPDHE